MSAINRRLAVTTPAMKGGDITDLQRAINKRYKHFQIDRKVTVDGEFGTQTYHAARQIAYAMGAGPNNRKAMRDGRVTRDAQRLILGRKKRRHERIATRLRAKFRRRLRDQYRRTPGQLALSWAKQQIGVTENPAGSNRGPKIDEWQSFFGISGSPWCGCFAGYAVKKIGGAKVTSWLPYAPSITADALANRNGLIAVPYSQARAGDLVTFWGGAHIGLVDRVEDGILYTCEGNTSSSDGGSQSNGGGVFARQRGAADVDVIARPNY